MDTSFADAGYKVIKGTDGSERFIISRLVAQTNKRILAIGLTSYTAERGLLISLEAHGEANTQFNRGAPLLTDLDGKSTRWRNANIQPDGKILVSGQSVTGRCVVARFDDRGTRDSNYGDSGWLFFDAPREASSSQVFTDGKLLFLASVTIDNKRKPCIARGLIN